MRRLVIGAVWSLAACRGEMPGAGRGHRRDRRFAPSLGGAGGGTAVQVTGPLRNGVEGNGPRLRPGPARQGISRARSATACRRPIVSSGSCPIRSISSDCSSTSTPSRSPGYYDPADQHAVRRRRRRPDPASPDPGPRAGARAAAPVPAARLADGGEGRGDRVAATQAVLEGHATLASISVLAPGVDVKAQDFWDNYKESGAHAAGQHADLREGSAGSSRVADLSRTCRERSSCGGGP